MLNWRPRSVEVVGGILGLRHQAPTHHRMVNFLTGGLQATAARTHRSRRRLRRATSSSPRCGAQHPAQRGVPPASVRSLACVARTSLRSRPPAIIPNAVWLHLRFTLGFRNVEDLIAERGPAC